jgi:hypothetical protein
LVLAYAAWVDPDFHVLVLETFEQAVENGTVAYASRPPMNLPNDTLEAELVEPEYPVAIPTSTGDSSLDHLLTLAQVMLKAQVEARHHFNVMNARLDYMEQRLDSFVDPVAIPRSHDTLRTHLYYMCVEASYTTIKQLEIVAKRETLRRGLHLCQRPVTRVYNQTLEWCFPKEVLEALVTPSDEMDYFKEPEQSVYFVREA